MKKEQYTETIKTRITPQFNEEVKQFAKSINDSVSSLTRKALAEYISKTDYSRKVELYCYKNAIYNRISALSIPKKTKEAILEVLNEDE